MFALFYILEFYRFSYLFATAFDNFNHKGYPFNAQHWSSRLDGMSLMEHKVFTVGII